MELTVLRKGMDTLDVAFQGAVSAAVLGDMRTARETARKEKSDFPISVNGVTGKIGETGARGGYAFRFDTGSDGQIWSIKDNTDMEQWNVRVEVRALALALYGYEGVKARLWRVLDAMGARVVTESVGRADFAVDFIADDFEIEPVNFVAHSHSRQNVRRDDPEGEAAQDGFSEEWRGGRCSGVTVGSMPNRQVTVYDKRAEQVRKVGSPWFKIWGYEKEDCPVVWRIEVRAGKRYLADNDVYTFGDLEAKIGDLYRDTLAKIRLVSVRDESNVTRSVTHPLWASACDEIGQVTDAWASNADPADLRQHSRDELAELYRKQMVGLAVSYGLVLGETARTARFKVADFFKEDWQSFAASGSDYRRKFKQSRQRLAFVLKGAT